MAVDTWFSLMYFAAYLVGAHILLSQLLRILVKWRSPLAMNLFAVPNAPIAPDLGFRLLRTKYFLPWQPAPTGMEDQPLYVRVVFWSARLTGMAAPLLILAFFGAAFYIVGSH
jgi:hypothetical protein